MIMENDPLNNPESTPHEPTEILVPSGSVNVAIRVALEHGKIDNELLLANTEDVELTEDQASALIEELQTQNFVSRERSINGDFERIENSEQDEQKKEVSGPLGGLSIRSAFNSVRQSNFVKTDVGHSEIAWHFKKAARRKAENPTEAQKAKQLLQRNTELAAASQASRDKKEKQAEWESNRKWKLTYESSEQPKLDTPVTPQPQGDSELMEKVLEGGSLFDGKKPTPAPKKAERKSEERKPRESKSTAGEIAELVKLKVLTPEEGRALLLGQKIDASSPTRTENEPDVTTYPKDQLKAIDDEVGRTIAEYLKLHGDTTPTEVQVEDKMDLRNRVVREYLGEHLTDDEVKSVLRQIKNLSS